MRYIISIFHVYIFTCIPPVNMLKFFCDCSRGCKHHLGPGHRFHHAGAVRFCMDYLQTVPWLTAMGEKFWGGNCRHLW